MARRKLRIYARTLGRATMVILAAGAGQQCHKSPISPDDSARVHIYLAGSIGQQASYWVDGVASLVPPLGREVIGVYVSRGRVYLAGTADYHAAYWENGTLHLLPGRATSAATGIFVENDTVYVSGYDRPSPGGPANACYWKNSVRHPLSSRFSVASSIVVRQGDVYVAGEENNAACYWKNGIKISLSSPYSSTRAIAVSDAGVVVGGNDKYAPSDYLIGVGWTWRDGTRTMFFYDSSGNVEHSGDLQGLALQNGAIYAVGRDNLDFQPLYWKNGRKFTLQAPNPFTTEAVAIAATADRVIIAGNYFDSESQSARAGYWQDGRFRPVPGEQARINAVFVTVR